MVWILVAAGIFFLIGLAMYAPAWLRWKARRRRIPARLARKHPAPSPLVPSLWYGAGGAGGAGGSGGGGSDCEPGGFGGFGGDGGGFGGGGFDGGGADGGGCD